VRGGDAPCQMLGFAFASGVCQLGVMGEPEEIGVGEGGGIEGDVVDGVVARMNVVWEVCMLFLWIDAA
jgi:hypothetical protein